MWHCIEERTDTLEKYGRIQRKILFNEVYSDRESLVAQKTKQIKVCYCLWLSTDEIFFTIDWRLRGVL